MSYYKTMKLQYWLSPAAPTLEGSPRGVIKLSVTLEGKEAQFSTKIKVLKADWSGRGCSVLSSDPEAREKNQELAAILSVAAEVEKKLRQREIEYSVISVIEVLRYLQKTKGVETKNLLSVDLKDKYINDATKKRQEEVKLKTLDALSLYRSYKIKRVKLNTATRYDYFEKKIKAWPGLEAVKFAEDFTESALLSLTEWMEDAGMKGTSISVYVSYYMGAMKHAKRKGLIKINHVSDFLYEYTKTYDYTYLTEAEQLRVTLVDNLSEEMDKARDVLRFTCLTSLHFTDYNNLTSDYISAKGAHVWLEKPRDKTGVEYCQIMHPHASQIIMKYGTIEEMPRFEYIQYYRFVIELGKRARINKHVTPKIGRKTFAYACLNKWGYSLEATAKMMGLSKTDTIAYYAKVGRERVEKEVKWHTM